MSEPKKNHLNIDGAQATEDEHVSSYKPIPESDTGFRSSKPSLSKSREKVSADGAEEKLLEKEDEARITTRVDMADAKYVVGDHRNGDAKIELDANKRQFSGLTKEELLKYAEDPFWVRLRWFMFLLFWALWLCMLAGAVAIIVRAPKCAPPPPKTWYQKGPLVDASSADSYQEIETELPLLQRAGVQGIFTYVCKDTYEVLETPTCIEEFKKFAVKAKEYGIKVIVDLTANFVSKTHEWFAKSENKTEEFKDFFVWAVGKGFDESGKPNRPNLPNTWVSTLHEPAWSWSDVRQEYYLHQFAADQPDLNFHSAAVVKQFDEVLNQWVKSGASGVRLHKARHLLVDLTLANETLDAGAGAAHSQYGAWRHQRTVDQPALDGLLAHFAHLVDKTAENPATGESVFTLAEDGTLPELFLLQHNISSLRPPSSAPLQLSSEPQTLVKQLRERLPYQPAIQLVSPGAAGGQEAAALAMLLPAAPVLTLAQLHPSDEPANETADSLSKLSLLRADSTVQFGNYSVAAVPAKNSTQLLIACARWKAGHTGYVAVYNPGAALERADLSSLPSLSAALTVHHTSADTRSYNNYTSNTAVKADDVSVPPLHTVVLSYVPSAAPAK